MISPIFCLKKNRVSGKYPSSLKTRKAIEGLSSWKCGVGGGVDEKPIIACIFLFKGKRAYRRRG